MGLAEKELKFCPVHGVKVFIDWVVKYFNVIIEQCSTLMFAYTNLNYRNKELNVIDYFQNIGIN